LSSGLKKTDTFIIKKRLVLEDKRILLKRVQQMGNKLLERDITRFAERLNRTLSTIPLLKREYRSMKLSAATKEKLQELKNSYKD